MTDTDRPGLPEPRYPFDPAPERYAFRGVPGMQQDPPVFTPADAVDDLAALGVDRDRARAMVDEHTAALSAAATAHGYPDTDPATWLLDRTSVAEILEHHQLGDLLDQPGIVADESCAARRIVNAVGFMTQAEEQARIQAGFLGDPAAAAHRVQIAEADTRAVLGNAADAGISAEDLPAREPRPSAGDPHPPTPDTAGGTGRHEPTAAAQTPGPEVVGLVCPECGEDAIERPPDTLVPYDAHELPPPVYSHPDGEPLCPVPGPRGYQPADPVEVHADPIHADDAEHVPPAVSGPEVAHAHQAVARALGDPSPPAPARAGEDARRAQLTRWHHDDDRTTAHAAEHEHGRGDVLDDGTGPR